MGSPLKGGLRGNGQASPGGSKRRDIEQGSLEGHISQRTASSRKASLEISGDDSTPKPLYLVLAHWGWAQAPGSKTLQGSALIGQGTQPGHKAQHGSVARANQGSHPHGVVWEALPGQGESIHSSHPGFTSE